jgi:hypothetical protein
VRLVVNDGVSPMVFEVREDDDGVQEEMAMAMAMMMLCSTRIFASCKSGEGRLELGGMAATTRAWMKMTE